MPTCMQTHALRCYLFSCYKVHRKRVCPSVTPSHFWWFWRALKLLPCQHAFASLWYGTANTQFLLHAFMFSVESVAVRNSSASDCQVTRIRAVTLSIFFLRFRFVWAHMRARGCVWVHVRTCAYYQWVQRKILKIKTMTEAKGRVRRNGFLVMMRKEQVSHNVKSKSVRLRNRCAQTDA